jgi:hypothetical protein
MNVFSKRKIYRDKFLQTATQLHKINEILIREYLFILFFLLKTAHLNLFIFFSVLSQSYIKELKNLVMDEEEDEEEEVEILKKSEGLGKIKGSAKKKNKKEEIIAKNEEIGGPAQEKKTKKKKNKKKTKRNSDHSPNKENNGDKNDKIEELNGESKPPENDSKTAGEILVVFFLKENK